MDDVDDKGLTGAISLGSVFRRLSEFEVVDERGAEDGEFGC